MTHTIAQAVIEVAKVTVQVMKEAAGPIDNVRAILIARRKGIHPPYQFLPLY